MRERIEFYSPAPECLHSFEREGFVAVENGTVHFLDPLDGNRIEQGEIPRALLEDDIFFEGIGALRRVTAAGVVLNIIYNLHGGEDDYEKLKAQAQELEQYKVVGLEWGSALGSEHPRRVDEIQFDTMTTAGNGIYCSRTKEWLAEAGVCVVPSDINTHFTVDNSIGTRWGQDRLRTRLSQVLSHKDKLDNADKETRTWQYTAEDWAEYGLAWSNYQYFRQYLLLAHFGYMVGRHEDQLVSGDRIGLVIGSGHAHGVPQKAAQLGIPTRSLEVQVSNDTPVRRIMFERAMPEGKISLDDLHDLAVHHWQANGW
jgi:hypothetical protein